MEFYQLRYFLAAYETGSFTQACGRVHVTQPTFSAGIRKLESHLDVRLFERDRRGVRPTPDGIRLYDYARRIVDTAGEARAAIKAVPASTPVRFGILRTLPGDRVAQFLARLQSEVRSLDLHLVYGDAVSLADRLRRNRLHFALTSLPEHDDQRSLPLFTTRLSVLVPSSHLFAARFAVRASDLQDQPLIVRPYCEFFAEGRSQLRARGVSPRFVARAQGDDHVLPMVAAGVGIAAGGDYLRHTGVVRLSIRDLKLTRSVVLAWADAVPRDLHELVAAQARSFQWDSNARPNEMAPVLR